MSMTSSESDTVSFWPLLNKVTINWGETLSVWNEVFTKRCWSSSKTSSSFWRFHFNQTQLQSGLDFHSQKVHSVFVMGTNNARTIECYNFDKCDKGSKIKMCLSLYWKYYEGLAWNFQINSQVCFNVSVYVSNFNKCHHILQQKGGNARLAHSIADSLQLQQEFRNLWRREYNCLRCF